MMHHCTTTVFNVGAEVIVNTVNCVGVMGNGLALECRLRYPEMFADYVERCRRGEVRIGSPYLYWYTPKFGILNFPCKQHWKYPSRLAWIAQGLMGVRALPNLSRITSIAFPILGCHLGRLCEADVRPMMERLLADLPTEIFVCADRDEIASGIEGEMVARFNGSEEWLHMIPLQRKVTDALRAVRPLRRFRDLRAASGIGKQTYERVHRLLYTEACGNLAVGQLPQPRLF